MLVMCRRPPDMFLQSRRKRSKFRVRDIVLRVPTAGSTLRPLSSGADSLFPDGGANIAERHPAIILDDRAPWAVLGDEDELLYARERRGLLLACELQIAIRCVRVEPARLACRTRSSACLILDIEMSQEGETHLWKG